MKKITAIVLLFLYLIPAIGLSVKQHYCGGKLASVSIVFKETPSCMCGKKAMKKDCCKDKTSLIKLKDLQNFSKTNETNFKESFKSFACVFSDYKFKFQESAIQRQVPLYHPPPLQKRAPLYLLNSVILI